MFSSALKSFSSNILSNYTIAANPSSTSGPWRIFDAKKKSTDRAVSVFVFDRKSLEPQGSAFGPRSGATSLKRLHDEVVERLRKEASALARLRHPNILELVEPMEETRHGGLMFATEPVTASLAGLLDEKTEQERQGGVGGRSSRHVVEDSDGSRRRREVEIDELEIQKGLLQVGKGLEFLHESAGLVHANLTPEAIFINAKSDWKISGLGFASPVESTDSSKPSSIEPIMLAEVLNYDARLPRTVQLNTDYSSPDFVMDNNLNTSADMFSLGLIVIALYNSPHRTPLETGYSTNTYKRLFSNASTIPTASNNYLCKQDLPRDVKGSLLPRLITRRPAQRMSAREFQQAQYFDNILVSTIRFLDSLPAKSPNEKDQFMRGLPRILPQFPKTVLEKKVLPALLEETKDHELLSLIMSNVFEIIDLVVNSQRAFSERVIPVLKNTFLSGPVAKGQSPGHGQKLDTTLEAGVMVILENMQKVTANCSGKDFKDNILPIILISLESPTHSVTDRSLQTVPVIIQSLDFSTCKNELFPVVAMVFSKTSSLAIKIRGLEALNCLCGGNLEDTSDNGDGLDGLGATKPNAGGKSTRAVLDKFAVQEKVVPLLRGIKTKEPAVMMAAMAVFRQVGKVADSDYLAMEVLPILWSFSLGPLLNLQQFQAFMTLIKSLSSRVESEQMRKLQELGSGSASGARAGANPRYGGTANVNGSGAQVSASEEQDFESLVTGRKNQSDVNIFDGGWASAASPRSANSGATSAAGNTTASTFAWSSTSGHLSSQASGPRSSTAGSHGSGTVTPDSTMGNFAALTPMTRTQASATSSWHQPLQPQQNAGSAMASPPYSGRGTTIDWSATMRTAPNAASSNNNYTAFSIAPPPNSTVQNGQRSGISMAYRPAAQPTGGMQTQQGQGLDKYESLI